MSETSPDSPRVSVCMPVYNAERYVSQAIESILGQTLGDFEFLILDDGSTDGSTEILRRYAGRDRRIRLTRRPHRGLALSLNELVDQSRGEFLARMDADDIALPHRLVRQVEYLRAHPDCVVVGCRVWHADAEGDPLSEFFTVDGHDAIDAYHLLGKGPALTHPSVVMRRDAVLAVGKYRDFAIAEDVDLFLRLAEYGRMARLPDFLHIYRVHDSNYSLTLTAWQRSYETHCAILTETYRRRALPVILPAGPQPAPQPVPRGLARDWAHAWWSLNAGHPRTALKYARRVLARRPLSLHSWRLMYCVLRGH